MTVPLADAPGFTDDQYGKALDALRKQGRYTEKAIKDVTGLHERHFNFDIPAAGTAAASTA